MAKRIRKTHTEKDAIIAQLQVLLEVNAYRVWSMSLDKGADAYQLVNRPVVGDMVMELTAIGRRSPKDGSNIGRLNKIVDRDGNEVADPGHRHDVSFLITTIDCREVVWGNAKFVKVFETLFDLDKV